MTSSYRLRLYGAANERVNAALEIAQRDIRVGNYLHAEAMVQRAQTHAYALRSKLHDAKPLEKDLTYQTLMNDMFDRIKSVKEQIPQRRHIAG